MAKSKKSNQTGWFARIAQMLIREPATRDELLDTLRDAKTKQLLDQDTLDTIERVIQVSDLRVQDVMIPRSQMVVVDRGAALDEMLPAIIESAHSRFPVVDGDRDKVVGILLAKDLLRFFDPAQRPQFNLREILRTAVFTPESKRLNVLLAEFRSSRNHMAIVVDEYGGVGGLVTIEDVLEQIVGDIEDEHDIDDDVGMVIERDEGDFIVKALYDLEEFDARFGTHFDRTEVDTIGGLVVNRFGYVPKRGEKIEFDGLEIEVLHADSRRLHILRVRPQ
jgi:magnesium and cobalt transporter